MVYEISETAMQIGELALRSMLYEVASHPSPGLVSPFSSGGHKDMDFFTFLRSSSALVFPVTLCAEIGLREDPGLIFWKIREIGIKAEERMFEVTSGVNTQKGLLFLESIISSAAGHVLSRGKDVTPNDISRAVSIICSGLTKNDFGKLKFKNVLTRGEKLYLEHGMKGIRGEVEAGLPTVMKYGLPALHEAMSAGLNDNDIMVHVLISIMRAAEDTNIAGKFSVDVLNEVKSAAREAMNKGGMLTEEGREIIWRMDSEFKERGISPGGSADLAAATLFVHLLSTCDIKLESRKCF
ncbi:MAG: triphosphoribosyl-dephospho-CoA synthase [Thermoanaerobacteraceae bacterium]|nr:triphosphoribosyl-dephospho-CoA synthase [Thermoanaerobacteraceae bacterium]